MVVVTIHGKLIDPNYTALLMEHQELPLQTVILRFLAKPPITTVLSGKRQW